MIEVRGLTKTFKVAKRSAGFREAVKALFTREYTTVEALKDVSFHIDKGEIVGYIGPNGAGKSTTIKVMSGILVPDKGEVIIKGLNPWKDRIHHVKNIGVVFGQRSQLWWDVPVIDSYELLKDIYKIPVKQYRETLDHLTEALELKEILVTPVRSLSLGQRMRCEIVASLLHSPEILFLDEPTIGLDALSKIAVRDFIKKINQERKVTVILTTHDMNDIEALASRIMMIGKGQILFDGALNDLRSRYVSEKRLTVDFASSSQRLELAGVSVLDWTDERARIKIDSSKVGVSEVIAELSKVYELKDVTVESEPVEELIVKLYKEFRI